jgi:hypothetical protein
VRLDLAADLAPEVHRVLGGDAREAPGARDRIDDCHVRVIADLPGLGDLAETGDLLAVAILDGDDDLRILEDPVLQLVDEQLLDLPVRRPDTWTRRPADSRCVPSVATRNAPVSSGSPYTRTSKVSSMPMRSAGSPALATSTAGVA